MNGSDNQENISKLRELIGGIKVAMLTTLEDDGVIRSRPMMVQETEFDGDLWFFTGADTPKVFQIQEFCHVNVSFSDPGKNRYVSISGTGRLVRGREKIKELWNPGVKAFLPNGPDDPNVALIKVTAEQAQYWDSPSGRVVTLIGFIKALASGEPAQQGESAKIDLKH